MSHLVKPTSFRAGKTLIWAHNTLLSTKQNLVNSNLTLAKGIERASRSLLRRKRLYVVRGSISNYINSSILYNLVFMPRVKTKPREHNIGAFMRRSIYKPFGFASQNNLAKNYVHARKDKLAKIRRRFKPKRLNRWLSKRMFRGAGKVVWRRYKDPEVVKFPVTVYLPDDYKAVNKDFYLSLTRHPMEKIPLAKVHKYTVIRSLRRQK